MVNKKRQDKKLILFFILALIIVVVIIEVLYALLPPTQAGNGLPCVASPGYVCQNMVLHTTGQLTFKLGQNTGITEYNLNIACASTANAAGYPNDGYMAFNSILANGNVNPNQSLGTSLNSGQTININGISCAGPNGIQLGSVPIGTTFTGFIWLNYTVSPGNNFSTSNPWHTMEVGTMSLHAV